VKKLTCIAALLASLGTCVAQPSYYVRIVGYVVRYHRIPMVAGTGFDTIVVPGMSPTYEACVLRGRSLPPPKDKWVIKEAFECVPVVG
jgi:hypothetical protein